MSFVVQLFAGLETNAPIAAIAPSSAVQPTDSELATSPFNTGKIL